MYRYSNVTTPPATSHWANARPLVLAELHFHFPIQDKCMPVLVTGSYSLHHSRNASLVSTKVWRSCNLQTRGSFQICGNPVDRSVLQQYNLNGPQLAHETYFLAMFNCLYDMSMSILRWIFRLSKLTDNLATAKLLLLVASWSCSSKVQQYAKSRNVLICCEANYWYIQLRYCAWI